MTWRMPRKPGASLVAGLCVTAVLGALPGAPTAAAQPPAAQRTAGTATEACPHSVATYVVEPGPSPYDPKTVRKYLDWNPQSGTNGTLIDSGRTVSIPSGPGGSRLFAGGNRRIYEISGWVPGTLKSYQDQTEAGGNLLSLEYTFAARSGQEWALYSKIWTDADGRVVALDDAGNLNVYVIQMPDGTPASVRMSRLAQLAASSPAVVELRKSERIWSAGNKIYGQVGSEVRAWDYSATLNSITLGPSATGAVQLSGLTDAGTAWSPAPGVFYTKTESGTVKSYTGAPPQLVNDAYATDVRGRVFANAAPCLSDGSDKKPHFGTMPDDSTVPPAPTEPPPPTTPTTSPNVVSGRFLLPDGTPAAGMPVVVEAADLLPEDDSAVDLPDLGKVTTAADGTWSLTIPDTLPATVQTAVDENSGALNVTATTIGRTESGVMLVGSDNLTAAPKNPVTGRRSTLATTASAEPDHTIKLLPTLPDAENNAPEPTEEQRKSTFAAWVDSQSTYDPEVETPRWQSDRGAAPQNHNPYVVGGKDITAERVTPYADTCRWDTRVVGRQISYTVVGESHAYWDAAGNVEYRSSLASTIDVGYSASGTLWSLNGSTTIGTSAAGISGFSWRGPHFAKQWKVPIEYDKSKRMFSCGGVVTQSNYEIRPGRFKVPAGGAPGVFGKDARHLDGPTKFAQSNPKYRGYLEPTGTWALDIGRSAKWAGAASAFGISFGGSTTWDDSHRQNIRAGGRTTYRHDVWGLRAPMGAQMGIIYSY